MADGSSGPINEPAVERLAKAINLFRAMDNTIPSQVVSVFLEVAANSEGIEARRLPRRVGLTQASVSRALLYLADTDWKDKSKPGLRLIVRQTSSRDARQRVVQLTAKGRRLVRQIDATLDRD